MQDVPGVQDVQGVQGVHDVQDASADLPFKKPIIVDMLPIVVQYENNRFWQISLDGNSVSLVTALGRRRSLSVARP